MGYWQTRSQSMFCLGGQESITGQTSVMRLMMDLMNPLRKKDLDLVESEETEDAGMK